MFELIDGERRREDQPAARLQDAIALAKRRLGIGDVLEHIEDDNGELAVSLQLLRPGGRLCLFVPALPGLYSSIDHKSGHFRRYTKKSLQTRVERAGFEVETIDYFDVASVVPYWLLYRVLGAEDLSAGSNAFYDRVLVPISRSVQRTLVHPPVGKNLILVARRPG